MANKVEYYHGTTLIGTGNVAPDYPFTTSGLPAGAISLTRKFYVDNVLKDEDTVNLTVEDSSGGTAPYEYFGLRKHNPNYTGPAITIQADGYDIPVEIGFDANGNLDTVALGDLSQTALFRIKVLHGQYNGQVLSQTTPEHMPIIMAGGSLQVFDGTVVANFEALSSQLVGPTTLTAENGLTAILVSGVTGTYASGSNKGLFGKWGENGEYALRARHFASPEDVSITSISEASTLTNSQTGQNMPIDQLSIISAVWGSTSQYVRINGVEKARTAMTGVRAGTNPFVLGGFSQGLLFTHQETMFRELLIYKSEVDPAADESEINAKYSLY